MRKWLLLVCGCLLTCSVNAATVRYFSGESEEGRLEFTPQGLVIGGKGVIPTPLDLSSILEISQRKISGSASALPAGVMLINGSIIADGTIPSLDGPTAELGAEHISVPTAAIGSLLFTPVAREKIEAIPAGQTGALLPNGDFFPGTFLGIKSGRVSLNSTLFGPQSFSSKGQISAVVLREIKAPATRFVITNIHGSRFLADELQIDSSGVVFRDSVLGAVRLKRDDLAELRAGAGRYKWLSELSPSAVAPPPSVDASTALRIPKDRPTDEASPPIITTASNAAITYAVPAGFTVFATSVSLPRDVPANARVTFAIYGDGRPLFRSPPYGPNDKPARLRVDLRSVRTLSIRVEPAALGSSSFGEWIGPIFLR